MKILSWNVNGIRASEKKGLSQWIATSNADIICLQETKAHLEQIPESLRNPISQSGTQYESFFASARRPGYSGTAIYALKKPDAFETFGVSDFDDEGRVCVARYGMLAIVCAYFPNSQEGGARLSYKLNFCSEMLRFCNEHVSRGGNIVLCGDYNIAHKPIDLANPKANEQNPGYLPEERAWMDEFLKAGYCDTFRTFCSEGGHYTWWSYRFRAREKNIGWRLDYACVNESLAHAVRSSEIQSDVYGSDHCPIALDIAL